MKGKLEFTGGETLPSLFHRNIATFLFRYSPAVQSNDYRLLKKNENAHLLARHVFA